MLCPNCLEDVKEFTRTAETANSAYACPICHAAVPFIYVRDYEQYSPVIFSLVGLRGHGKTIFMSSLFYQFKHSGWPNPFRAMPLDEEGFQLVHEKLEKLEQGTLPGGTTKLFPKPVILQLSSVPKVGDCRLLIYDTSGEAFDTVAELKQYASYVTRSRAVVWLVSLDSLRNPEELQKFLIVYLQAVHELEGDPSHQELIVVLTKGDQLTCWNQAPPVMKDFLSGASPDGSAECILSLHQLSDEIEAWLDHQPGYRTFVRHAKANFGNVRYCVVSALGSAPTGDAMNMSVVPRGVIAPLLWLWLTFLPSVTLEHGGQVYHYFTVEEAVRHAPAGATVKLSGGLHRLKAPLTITRPLRLEGAGVEQTRIVGTVASANSDMLLYTGLGRFVATGISFEWQGGERVDVVTIERGTVDIRECRFYGGEQRSGLDRAGLGVTSDVTGRIVDSEFTGNTYGIVIAGTAMLQVERNSCYNNRESGIAFVKDARGVARRNKCFKNGGDGITMFENAHPELDSNDCQHNREAGIAYFGTSAGTAKENICDNNKRGIMVSGHSQPAVEGNTCRKNHQAGIVWDSPNAQHRKNECRDNPRAEVKRPARKI